MAESFLQGKGKYYFKTLQMGGVFLPQNLFRDSFLSSAQSTAASSESNGNILREEDLYCATISGSVARYHISTLHALESIHIF